MTFEEHPGFDPRLAWASQGGTLLAGACPVLVVVDILRFTTAVEVAVAHGAVAAFLDAAPDLASVLAACTSGRELADRGLTADMRLAAEHDVSQAVPRLSGGAFSQLSWPG
jgi:phosphosulfolactate phosphohydrolase-like enzyme